jgi:hypothetical protein
MQFAGKNYNNDDDEQERFKHYAARYNAIQQHNADYAAGRQSYSQGINPFADWVRMFISTIYVFPYFPVSCRSRPAQRLSTAQH